MDSDVAQGRLSRRRMLKRIGAGAAVAWATPVLTSVRTPVFAASGGSCPSDCCVPGVCISEQCICESCGCKTGRCTSPGCFAAFNTEGMCQFFQREGCPCLARCSNSSECPPGQQCLCPDNGCGVSVCVSCCGQNCHGAGRSSKGGATNLGH
jgi:hypothetical protein